MHKCPTSNLKKNVKHGSTTLVENHPGATRLKRQRLAFSLVNIRTTKRVIHVAVYKTHHLILHDLSSVLVPAKMTNYYKHLYLEPPREFDPHRNQCKNAALNIYSTPALLTHEQETARCD